MGDTVADRSGIDLWRGFVAGDLPPPPLHHLTGAMPVAVEEGTITWTMPASRWLCSPTGFVEGGFLAYLADAATATASATLAHNADGKLVVTALGSSLLLPGRNSLNPKNQDER